MTPQETAQRLLALDHILILTHRRPDGDTIGCASALCLALRQKGKTAWLLPNEDAHHLFDPYLEGVLAPADFVPQAVVAVDVAALGMLPDSAQPYRDRIDLAIDHHGSQEGYARATCVDPDSAACGEVLFRVFQAMEVSLSPQIALLLYMAIATDTGCFVYSNTTPATHRIAAALMDTGFDAQWVNKRHFRVKSLKRMQIESRLVREMDLAQNGTLVFAYVTLDLIRDLQATEEDLEDIASFIGQLEGVDNAVTIRQLKPTECKISLRTDGKTLNASDVCAIHGGGGHPAAAGCTIHGTPAQAKAAGLTLGGYLKDLGFQLDLAPVADVHTGDGTALLGERAFLGSPEQAAMMISATVEGFHQAGMACTLKHFPGYGDAVQDPLSGYATTDKTWEEMRTCELYPFQAGMASGADAVMVAHITTPNATEDGLPASLSYEMITQKLRGELRFQRVVITDSLSDPAITQRYEPGQAALLAFQAGADVLLLPQDLEAAYGAILTAVQEGAISQERLDASVLRILHLKEVYGLL